MGNRLDKLRPDGMWKLVFYERTGMRITMDKTAPWLPSRAAAQSWAEFYIRQGYHVGLQAQDGKIEKLCEGLPG